MLETFFHSFFFSPVIYLVKLLQHAQSLNPHSRQKAACQYVFRGMNMYLENDVFLRPLIIQVQRKTLDKAVT